MRKKQLRGDWAKEGYFIFIFTFSSCFKKEEGFGTPCAHT
jgi:hypothetical protein